MMRSWAFFWILLLAGLASSFCGNTALGQVLETSYGPHAQQRLDYYQAYTPNSPIVVVVHGGSFSRGDKNRNKWERISAYFQSRGFAVLNINYRLDTLADYPGYPAQPMDLACAIAWAKNNAVLFNGDSSRVAVFGHSAGAYITSAFIFEPPNTLLGGCPNAASLNVDAVLLSAGGYQFDPGIEGEISDLFVKAFKDMLGDSAAHWHNAQPVYHTDRSTSASFLLLHGRQDSVIDHRQSTLMFNLLRENGHTVRMRKFPGIGHDLSNEPEESPAFPEITDFLYSLWGMAAPKRVVPHFYAYPNPIPNQHITLRSKTALSGMLSLQIVDPKGVVVCDLGTKFWEGPSSELSLWRLNLRDGLYFLRIHHQELGYTTAVLLNKVSD
ncbi:MAG: alpha/beta hydrolase [Bacteroidota bacterium]